MKSGHYIAIIIFGVFVVVGISFYAGINYEAARMAKQIAIADRDTTDTEVPVQINLPPIEETTEAGVIVPDDRLTDRIDSLQQAVGDLEKTIEYLASPFTVTFHDRYAITKLYIDPIDKIVTRSVTMLPVTIYAPYRIERIYVPIEKTVVRRGTSWYWDVRLYAGAFTAGYLTYRLLLE